MNDVPPNSAAVGPPPVGLVIASVLTWDQLQKHFPGIENYWWPADGRAAPEDTVLGRILAEDDTAPTLPDLQGKILAGMTNMTGPEKVQARPGLSVGVSDQPTHSIYYYVRVS